MYHNCANKGVDSVVPKVTSNTACRFFHATSSTGKVGRGAPPTVSSRLLISALEKTSTSAPFAPPDRAGHRRTAPPSLTVRALYTNYHNCANKGGRQWDSDSVAFGVPM